MIDLDELIAALRERAASDSPAHTLMNEAADALEAATRVPGQGEPNNDRENLITERTYGHGSITLTHYRSSGRIGVVQRGENSVMDVADLLVFLQDSGLDEVFSHATVPDAATDAREYLHAKCDCVPDLGPAHCHLCSADGSPVEWANCVAVQQVTDAPETVEVAFKTVEVERLGHLLVQLSPATPRNGAATVRRLMEEMNIKEVVS